MKNERALGPLQQYLNSRECPVFEERAVFHPPVNAPRTSIFDACAGLKAAAVNVIAYINSRAAPLPLYRTFSIWLHYPPPD
jgi:hypothetical protein